MRLFAVLPVVTAAVAVLCALWAPARRFVWPAVALAAVNVVLTPLTSGEWFYQRAEDASYERSVARGDFGAIDRLLGQHDPHLQPRMVAMAVALLVALVGVAVLRAGGRRGVHGTLALSRVAAGAVLLAAAATVVQCGLLFVG